MYIKFLLVEVHSKDHTKISEHENAADTSQQ